MDAAPSRAGITGLVLAGGRALRMGGIDKGLQPWQGRPLVDHVIERLRPQVASLLISANRHEADYARRGWPVLADDPPQFAGPLAGMLAGLRAARTPWLVVVPCDMPGLPGDLVERLAAALSAGAPAAVAETLSADGQARAEPVCCLLSVALAPALADCLARGGHKVEAWLGPLARRVRFDRPHDAAAFANFNRLADLGEITASGQPPAAPPPPSTD